VHVGLSFEFFPPNTETGEHKLREVRRHLARLRPDFFSVTFGAGGATRDKTRALVEVISREFDNRESDNHEAESCGFDHYRKRPDFRAGDTLHIPVAPHLSCIGQDRTQLGALLEQYRAMGISRIVALRGDLPSGMVQGGEFRFAEDLVAFIREHHGNHFHVVVAAYPEMHPQAASPQADLRAFVRKVRKGASSAITQYFFNADAYFRFRDEVAREGVELEIVPGIMPITNTAQLLRFSDSCGAEIPRWIRLKLASFGDDRNAIRAFGRDVVAALCRRLIEGGAKSLHFYTLNQSEPSTAIIGDLGLAGEALNAPA
jgi:methylenetetrahydrofolate reductase (NADPH)